MIKELIMTTLNKKNVKKKDPSNFIPNIYEVNELESSLLFDGLDELV